MTKPIRQYWEREYKLRGPDTPDGRCSYAFTAQFDDGTAVTNPGTGFPVSFSDANTHDYIEFSFTVNGGCTLTPLYWMPRAYSDLSLDKQNYDYFARNEYCYPYPLLCSAADSCKSLGAGFDFTNSCSKATDGANVEHTVCRNDDVCFLKDTSISDA